MIVDSCIYTLSKKKPKFRYITQCNTEKDYITSNKLTLKNVGDRSPCPFCKREIVIQTKGEES